MYVFLNLCKIFTISSLLITADNGLTIAIGRLSHHRLPHRRLLWVALHWGTLHLLLLVGVDWLAVVVVLRIHALNIVLFRLLCVTSRLLAKLVGMDAGGLLGLDGLTLGWLDGPGRGLVWCVAI